eukprot:132819_1
MVIFKWLLFNVLLYQCHSAVTLWQDDMQSDNRGDWTATIEHLSFLTVDSNCPDPTKNCYRLCGYFWRSYEMKINTGSTSGYTDIVFNYDVHTSGIDGSASCIISWSSDDNNYNQIKSPTDNDGALLNQQSALPQSQNVWIKVTAGTTSSDCCYISNFKIEGTAPTSHPTVSPSVAITNNPTKSPTNIPTNIPSISPTKYPTLMPSKTPTFVPTNSPTVVDIITRDPTVSPVVSTVSPNYWICDDGCYDIDEQDDGRIRIEVVYWFSDRIEYNMKNIECFLYKIFVEWFQRYQFAETFTVCDIDVIDILGIGIENNDETFCEYGPCLYSNGSEIRRLLQNNDGNTTMTIITDDENTYVSLNELAINSMITEFETAFLDNFDVIIKVNILVADENESNEEDLNTTNNTNSTFNSLYYIIIGACVLLCCIMTVILCYCIRAMRLKHKVHNRKISVSDMNDENEGNDIETTTTVTKKIPNTKTKLKHKRSNTIDSWDITRDDISIGKQTVKMWQNEIYKGKSISTLQETGINSNKESIEMITHNKLYTDGKRKQQQHKESDDPFDKKHPINAQQQNNNEWQNYNFNAYVSGVNQYQQNMQNNINFQHAPHATMGINSIQPNIVNKLAKKYNNKNQRKQSEMVDDESSESNTIETDEEEESSTNTLSDDNESDDQSDEIDVLDNEIAEKIGDSGGDILTNMKGLLSFQHIDCEDNIDKRPTGSVIVHRD